MAQDGESPFPFGHKVLYNDITLKARFHGKRTFTKWAGIANVRYYVMTLNMLLEDDRNLLKAQERRFKRLSFNRDKNEQNLMELDSADICNRG